MMKLYKAFLFLSQITFLIVVTKSKDVDVNLDVLLVFLFTVTE